MIRTIYKLVALNSHPESLHYFTSRFVVPFLLMTAPQGINKKYLREYRCPNDNKLLAKGFLKDSGSILEAKCRACGEVSYFQGEDKEIILVRKDLLEQGKIPDTE